MERNLLAFLSVLLVALPGQARDPLQPEEVADIIEQFQYAPVYQEVSSKQTNWKSSGCWTIEKVFETKYPDLEEPFKVAMTMYIPNRKRLGDKTVPAVIMIPPVGGVNLLDKRTAGTLCDSKIAGIIVANDFANIQYQADKALLPPEDHQKTFHRIGAAVKGIMKMISDDKNLDYDRVGMFGVSLGGILGSFVMATQPDIAAGYFVVAGGDVPQILATSKQDEVSKIRARRMREQGFKNSAEYEEFLREYITFDPADLGITMPRDTINMMISRQDTRVPTENQFLLHKAFNEPEATYSSKEHLMAIFGFLFPGAGRKRIARFFTERFKLENPRPKAFDWIDNLIPAMY